MEELNYSESADEDGDEEPPRQATSCCPSVQVPLWPDSIVHCNGPPGPKYFSHHHSYLPSSLLPPTPPLLSSISLDSLTYKKGLWAAMFYPEPIRAHVTPPPQSVACGGVAAPSSSFFKWIRSLNDEPFLLALTRVRLIEQFYLLTGSIYYTLNIFL